VISPGVAGPEVVDAFVGVAGIAELQVSGDIALAFDVLVPVAVVAVEVYSSGRPRFHAFPNVDYFASSSSSVEVVREESVHSSTGVRTNYGLDSVLSNLGLHQNKNLEYVHNKPTPGHSNVSDTNDLPIDATTNHTRKTCLHLCQEQRTHSSYQASLSHSEVLEIQWVVAEKFQYLHLPLPLLEQERQLPTQRGLSPKVTFSFCYLLIPTLLISICNIASQSNF
jgi:hypothetical protein